MLSQPGGASLLSISIRASQIRFHPLILISIQGGRFVNISNICSSLAYIYHSILE